jgi:hypothetical protein
MACGAVANIVKSSLGPVGLDKVLILFLWLQLAMLVVPDRICFTLFVVFVATCNR